MSEKLGEELALKETPKVDDPATLAPITKPKTYTITSREKSFTATAHSIAWTENGQFILLMEGETTKHIIVAANVIAVTET